MLKALKSEQSGEQTENDKHREKSPAEDTHDDEKRKSTNKLEVVTPAEIWNENDAIFERLVLIIPYKSPEMVK
jgi:hypothetical protein